MPRPERVRSRSARRLRAVAAPAACLLALGPVAAAHAQAANPFTPLPPANTAPPTTSATTTATTTAGSSSGVSSGTIFAALAGAIVLILAIGWFIARDARRVAPVPERPPGAPAGASRERLRRQQRARAKAARRQRKRNR